MTVEVNISASILDLVSILISAEWASARISFDFAFHFSLSQKYWYIYIKYAESKVSISAIISLQSAQFHKWYSYKMDMVENMPSVQCFFMDDLPTIYLISSSFPPLSDWGVLISISVPYLPGYPHDRYSPPPINEIEIEHRNFSRFYFEKARLDSQSHHLAPLPSIRSEFSQWIIALSIWHWWHTHQLAPYQCLSLWYLILSTSNSRMSPDGPRTDATEIPSQEVSCL